MRYKERLVYVCGASALILLIFFIWSFGTQRADHLNISIDPLTNQTASSATPFDLLNRFLEIYGDGDDNSSVSSSEEVQYASTSTHKKVDLSQLPPSEATTGSNSGIAPCPSVPIVSGLDGGRLGNKIWEYAAVWGLARLLGRPGYMPRSLLDSLGKVFANLSLPAVEEIAHCGVRLGAPVKKWNLRPIADVADKFRNKNLLLEQWILLPEPVLLFKHQLRKEFRFQPALVRQVEDTIQKAHGQGKVLVGIHVRRTDFAQFLPKYFNASLVGEEFFKGAIKWFRKNVPGPKLFLIVSDDLDWCRKHLLGEKDVLIAGKSPAHDLALLSTCNHTIIDYGTFGYWAALIADGHTISLNVDKILNKLMMERNDKWHVFEQL